MRTELFFLGLITTNELFADKKAKIYGLKNTQSAHSRFQEAGLIGYSKFISIIIFFISRNITLQ